MKTAVFHVVIAYKEMDMVKSTLLSHLIRGACLAAVVAILAPLASAATFNESIGVNGGTLSWTVTTSFPTCGQSGQDQYTLYNFDYFKYSYTYTSATGAQIPLTITLGGSANYIDSPGGPYCPATGPEPANALLTDSTHFYRVDFSPEDSGYGSASMEGFSNGIVNPKYVVLSVIYQPPSSGLVSNQSYVDYSSTTNVGTDTSFASSFSSSASYSETESLQGVSRTIGSTNTQEDDTSSSIAINKTKSVSDTYPGTYPAITMGLNHDNDVILLWINPAVDCATESTWSFYPSFGNAVQCVEYDPNMAPGDPDNPKQDIVQLPVGWLNGDYSMNSDVYNILESHGITSADYASILEADPYHACRADISCVQQIGVSSTRFTPAAAPIIDFETDGNSTNYTASYNNVSAAGQGAKDTRSVSFSMSGTASFQDLLKASLTNTQSQTFTWVNQWSHTMTYGSGQSAILNVAEPSATSGYSGPTQFEVYEDNVYGTFMLYPTQ